MHDHRQEADGQPQQALRPVEHLRRIVHRDQERLERARKCCLAMIDEALLPVNLPDSYPTGHEEARPDRLH